ncbi:MAG: hypothetical protein PHW04_01870 [Candidatus Wallbacteria bacterium]|nr:hypothetical protein [Candidatus Wallbacteria bacterium]
MILTNLNGKKLNLRPSEIESFHDESGITILTTRDRKTYKIKEDSELIERMFLEERTRRGYRGGL